MIPPRRSDRNSYDPLRDTEKAVAPEVVPDPIRPDTVRSPGWTDQGNMEAQQRSALEYAKRADLHLQHQKIALKQQDTSAARDALYQKQAALSTDAPISRDAFYEKGRTLQRQEHEQTTERKPDIDRGL